MTRPTALTAARPSTPAPALTTAWISSALYSPDWVDAGPFRAHLHYLVGISRLSGRVVAQHCGIPTRLADRLLAVGDRPTSTTGAPVRRVRRISHWCAARLLAVGPSDLAQLRWCNVDSGPTLDRLGRLVRAGYDLRAVAAAVDASATELTLLHTNRWTDCLLLIATQVDAACQVLLGEGAQADPGEEVRLGRCAG